MNGYVYRLTQMLIRARMCRDLVAQYNLESRLRREPS